MFTVPLKLSVTFMLGITTGWTTFRMGGGGGGGGGEIHVLLDH